MLFGVGAVILMNTRPFEGAILTAIALAISSPALFRSLKAQRRQFLFQLAVPAVAVLALGVAGLGYYCYRVTGKATLMPYQVNRRTYGWPENLAFLHPAKVSVRDPVLREMYNIEVAHHDIYSSPSTFIDNLVTRLFDNWAYLVGPALTIPLLFALSRCLRQTRYLVLLLGSMVLVNLSQLLLYPYHLAPVVPVLFCLITIGIQYIYEFLKRVSGPRSYYLVTFLPVCLLLATTVKLFSDTIDIPAVLLLGTRVRIGARCEGGRHAMAQPETGQTPGVCALFSEPPGEPGMGVQRRQPVREQNRLGPGS